MLKARVIEFTSGAFTDIPEPFVQGIVGKRTLVVEPFTKDN
jgi:hypothetical protein